MEKKSRRSFLKKLAAGCAAAAAAGMLKPRPVTARSARERKADDEILYRETPAFKEYYDSLKS